MASLVRETEKGWDWERQEGREGEEGNGGRRDDRGEWEGKGRRTADLTPTVNSNSKTRRLLYRALEIECSLFLSSAKQWKRYNVHQQQRSTW